MDAKTYVYAYLLLSVIYAAACVQYVNVLTRTAQIAKGYRMGRAGGAGPDLENDDVREATQTAVRSVLGVDSAAFACAVLPVAYVAVTGLFGNLVSRNTASATALNPMWLLVTVALVVGHMVFLSRLITLNGKLSAAEDATLSASFVSRHASMLSYYRVFILAVTLFNVVNTLYIVATFGKVTSMPYVGM
jgi:hypothetical protein